jgi:hypothetical protein
MEVNPLNALKDIMESIKSSILNEIYSSFENKIKSQNSSSTEKSELPIIDKSLQTPQSTQTKDSTKNNTNN